MRSDRIVHWTPEEHDQPACDGDLDDGAPAVMWGTLNPHKVTCPACRAILDGGPA